MIPSDHFVKFYNEIFKYLLKQGPQAIAEYYQTISRHQETHCLKRFQERGLQGMYEYWQDIIREENCDAEGVLEADKCFQFNMHKCPSLSKVIDNDAGASPIYCNHCAGWIFPIMTKLGYYIVYDLVGLEIPRCQFAVFKNLEDAQDFKKLAEQRHPGHPELVLSNF